MMRPLLPRERPLDWVGSSKRDFLDFPARVRAEMADALGLAQLGGKHPSAKPWKGEGPAVFEIVENHRGDTYRAIYLARFQEVVYVLHAFQKKSPKGRRTAKRDVDMVTRRLRVALIDYEACYAQKRT